MKSYESRLLLLQLCQARHGVPVSEEHGQPVPALDEIEAFVLVQKAALLEKRKAA